MQDYANIKNTTKTKLTNLDIAVGPNPGIAQAETAARKALGTDSDNTVLVAWWDKKRHTGSPVEACSNDDEGCSRDYATSHGATTKVTVNDGLYEFFYGDIPAGHEQLMKDQAIALRREFGEVEMRGVIGG